MCANSKRKRSLEKIQERHREIHPIDRSSKKSASASSQTRKCPTRTNTEVASFANTAKRQLNQSLKASQNLYFIVALESMSRYL